MGTDGLTTFCRLVHLKQGRPTNMRFARGVSSRARRRWEVMTRGAETGGHGVSKGSMLGNENRLGNLKVGDLLSRCLERERLEGGRPWTGAKFPPNE